MASPLFTQGVRSCDPRLLGAAIITRNQKPTDMKKIIIRFIKWLNSDGFSILPSNL